MAEEFLKLTVEANVAEARKGLEGVASDTQSVVDNFQKIAPAANSASSGFDKLGSSARAAIPSSDQVTSSIQKQVTVLTKYPPLVNTSADSTKKFVDQLKATNSVLLNVASGTPKTTQQITKLQIGVSALGDSLETLKAKANVTREFINTERDSTKIEALNLQLKELEAEILRVQNIGKQGIIPAEVSEQAFAGLISGANTAFTALRRIAFVLPGIGVAGILGGLSDAIISLGKELINLADHFDEAEIQAAQFQNQLKSLNDFIESTKGELDFSAEIDKLKNQLTFGPGFQTDILGKAIDIDAAKKKLDNLNIVLDEDFRKLNGLLGNARNVLSQKGKELFDSFGGVPDLISDELIQKLDKNDQTFLNNIKEVSKQIAQVNKDRGELQRQIEKDNLDKQVQTNNENLKQQKDAHDKLIKENEEFIKRTISLAKEAEKFFDIPINLRLTGFEDQAEAFQKALQTITGIKEFQIKLKPTVELPDIKELPKEDVQRFFKNVPDALQDEIEKGLLQLPVDGIEIPVKPGGLDPEGAFSKEIEAIIKKFNDSKIEIPLDVEVRAANGEKGADLLKDLSDNFDNALKEANFQKKIQDTIDKALENISVEGLTSIGETIGEALAGGDISNAFAAFGKTIGQAVETIGKQLIALGTAALLAKQALKSLFTNPALTIIAGVALVAIGKALESLLGGGLKGFAKGGRYPVGEDIIVGEKGREIVRFDRPGTIIPNHKTESILSSSVRDYHEIKYQFREFKNQFYSHRDQFNNFRESVSSNIKEHFTSLTQSFTNKLSDTLQYISKSHREVFTSLKTFERLTEKVMVKNFTASGIPSNRFTDKFLTINNVTNNFFSSENLSNITKNFSPEKIANILNLPKFATGGAVFAPTLALLGEGFGVSRSNPEFVGTRDQLKGIQGGVFDVNVTVGGDVSISMGKLGIALNAYQRSQLRTNGKKPF